MRRVLVGSLVILVLVAAYYFTFAGDHVDRLLNTVVTSDTCRVPELARQLHEELVVADLHCDVLLWSRDLLVRANHGHADLPRLIEGNVALQVFSVVTKVPWGMNYSRNSDRSDATLPLVVAQRWPRRTWFSLRERALYQASRFHEAVARSKGNLIFVGCAEDLERHLEAHAQGAPVVAGVLAIEGLHALQGQLQSVDAFYEAGFRVMAPVHFFDNEVGGSAHGVSKEGLTDFGRQVIKRMEDLGIVVDLAHASQQLFDDVMRMVSRPVIVSHTGVRGTCEGARNLSDEQIVRVARNGGVIGIGFWEGAACGIDTQAIARAIRYVADLVGVDHVALGSDFDGATRTRLDASRLVCITAALLDAGFSEMDVKKIMGGNTLRLLMATLPRGDVELCHGR